MSTDSRAGEPRPPVETLASRLRDVELPTGRFIKVEAGEKEPVEPWRDSTNQYEPDDPELRVHVEQGGNVGVVCGRGLVVVDVDDPDASPEALDSLPGTLTVESGGGGTHLYFRSEWDKTKNHGGGEIRADGAYVVAPGSTHPSGGVYSILVSTRVTRIPPETLGFLVDSADGSTESKRSAQQEAKSTQAGVADETQLSIGTEGVTIGDASHGVETVTTSGSVALSDDERDRLRTMFDGERGDQLQALAHGEYAAEGFAGDRSAAEMSLANALAFYWQNDPEDIARVMTWLCDRWPGTDDGEPRKWAERDDVYRDVTVSKACNQARTYSEPSPSTPYEDRLTVSAPTRERVMDAVRDLYRPTTKEIAAHDRVDVEERQVRNALSELEVEGYVHSTDHPDDSRKDIYLPVRDDDDLSTTGQL